MSALLSTCWKSVPTAPVAMAFGVLAFAAAAVAQEEGVSAGAGLYPRPHIVTEGDVVVRSNDLAIKYYVSDSSQSGAIARSGEDGGAGAEYYVFYEPPIFLRTVPAETGAGRKLDTRISDDGIVTLHFYWDTDVEKTRDAIRAAISGTAYAGAAITPFFVEDSWFESALNPELRSISFPRHSFTTGSGTMRAYFQLDSYDAAERFVAALNGEGSGGMTLQLNFRYTFSGVTRDICAASVSGEQMRETSRLKDLEGRGSEARVTRQQASEMADEIFREVSIQTTCRDVGAADRLVRTALEQLGSPDKVTLDTWEKFDRFTELSPNDFAANVSRSLEASNESVDRTQWRSADVGAEQIAAGLKAATSAFWGAASAALSASFEHASQTAQSRFLDLLEKNSVSLNWTGEKFEPKDVDVYTKDRVVGAWGSGVSIRYTRIADRVADAYNIPLTEKNHEGVVSATPEDVSSLREEIELRMEEIEESARDRMTEIRGYTSEHLQTINRAAEAQARMRREALDEAREILADAKRERREALDEARGILADAQREVRVLEDEIGRSMDVRAYTFDLSATRANYPAGHFWSSSEYISTASLEDYEAAFIGGWGVGSCTTDSFPSPAYPPDVQVKKKRAEDSLEVGDWAIVVRPWTTPCDSLHLTVVFLRGEVLGNSWRRWYHGNRGKLVLTSGAEK